MAAMLIGRFNSWVPGPSRWMVGLGFWTGATLAQNPSPQVQTIWMNSHSLLVVPETQHSPTPLTLESVEPDGSLHRIERPGLEFSSGYGEAVDYSDGSLWGNLARTEDGPNHQRLYVTEVLRKDPDSKWQIVGVFRQFYYYSADIFPLENGRFLAYFGSPTSRDMKVAPPGGYHPLAILHPTSGRTLEVESWQDLDLDEPYWHRPSPAALANPYHLAENQSYPGLGLEACTSQMTRVGRHFILPAMRAGWFFVFSAKDGHLERKVQLYASVDEKRLKDPSLGWVVIGYQATSDGRLLVAARQEAGIASFHPIHVSPDLSDEEFNKLLPAINKKMDENLANYAVVMWYTIDPDKGSVHDEAPPRDFPDFVKSQAELENYRFRFKADGNLLFLGKQPSTTK